MYTSWTDGSVTDDVTGAVSKAGSGGKPGHGFNSTTGQAEIVGDDPFALQVPAAPTAPTAPTALTAPTAPTALTAPTAGDQDCDLRELDLSVPGPLSVRAAGLQGQLVVSVCSVCSVYSESPARQLMVSELAFKGSWW